jgi:hypothetical protein
MSNNKKSVKIRVIRVIRVLFLLAILTGCETSSSKGTPESAAFASALEQAKGLQKEVTKLRKRTKAESLKEVIREMEPTVVRLIERLMTLQENYGKLQEVRQKFDREALEKQQEDLWEKSGSEDDPRKQVQYERHLAQIERQLTLIDRLQGSLDAYGDERDYIVTTLQNLRAELALLEANPEKGAPVLQEMEQLSEHLLVLDQAMGEVNKEKPLSLEDVAKLPELPDAGTDESASKVPLTVIEYSSQKDPSQPASAAADGRRGTAWVSSPSSVFPQYLVFATADKNLYDVSSVQICTAPPKSQQAAMAVQSMTLFSSQEVESSRILSALGTYTFPQGRTCHRFKFAAPIPLRVLVLQINQSAGDPSALVSEVTAYGRKHE